jgi:Tetratricopeptide repeat.
MPSRTACFSKPLRRSPFACSTAAHHLSLNPAFQDDVLYLKAQIAEKKRDYEQAVAYYQEIVEKFPDDIRADNALYAQALLFEEKLEQPQKAMELYEKLFVDYSDSVFSVDARKRYRLLRGDKVQ